MDPKTTGQFISFLRKEKGMTQKELADMLNITDKAVSKWERDVACPDINTLPKLAEIFGTTVDLILTAEPAGTAEDGREIPTSQKSIAEQMYELQKQDEARRAEERRQRLRRQQPAVQPRPLPFQDPF